MAISATTSQESRHAFLTIGTWSNARRVHPTRRVHHLANWRPLWRHDAFPNKLCLYAISEPLQTPTELVEVSSVRCLFNQWLSRRPHPRCDWRILVIVRRVQREDLARVRRRMDF